MSAVVERFDPSAPEVFADPYPEYARLRALGPLARGFAGQWVLPRHAEVSALLRDKRLTKLVPPEVYESLVGRGPSSAFLARMQELFHNRRVVGLLVKALNPAVVPAIAARAAAAVDELLSPARETRRLDAVADLGTPLAVRVVCELFGIPRADHERFRLGVAAMIASYNDSVVRIDPAALAGVHAAGDEAVTWQQDYLAELVPERRARPGDDVVSALLAPDDDGSTLDDRVVADSVLMCFYAGFETAAAMMSTGLAELAAEPGQWARLRSDRSLVASTVEEFARFDAPIQIGVRRALADFELAGRTIRAGRLLVLLLGSANRDERVFADPDRLDVGRRPNPHVAYGAGLYHCLGAALARIEATAAVEGLLGSFGTLELAETPVRRHRFNFRTYESVPLAVGR